MKQLALLVLAGSSMFGSLGNSADVLSEHTSGSIRYLVQVGDLDERAFIVTAMELLRPREVKFGRVVRYGSHTAALVIERASRLTGCSWEAFVADAAANSLHIEPGRCPAVMEAIKIGSSIVLRSVDAKCVVRKELILGTADPLWIDIGAERHEILALQVRKREGTGRSGGSVKLSTQLFVRTSAPLSIELARAIIEHVRTICEMEDLYLVVRNDAAFFGSCMFPSPYLFSGSEDWLGPGPGQHVTGGEVVCGFMQSKPINCWYYQAKR